MGGLWDSEGGRGSKRKKIYVASVGKDSSKRRKEGSGGPLPVGSGRGQNLK